MYRPELKEGFFILDYRPNIRLLNNFRKRISQYSQKKRFRPNIPLWAWSPNLSVAVEVIRGGAWKVDRPHPLGFVFFFFNLVRSRPDNTYRNVIGRGRVGFIFAPPWTPCTTTIGWWVCWVISELAADRPTKRCKKIHNFSGFNRCVYTVFVTRRYLLS